MSTEKGKKEPRKQGKAYLPSTLLTVEYVDEEESMDSVINQMSERLRKLEGKLDTLEENYQQLLSTIKQQGQEVQNFVQSLYRRIDQIYRGGRAGAPPQVEAPDEETRLQVGEPGPAGEIPQEFANDTEHQDALRTARVMASDLAAYYPSEVEEGALYASFYEVLKGPIAEARKTYRERVPKRITEQFDYFQYAIKELIAAKQEEVQQEEPEAG